MQGVTKVTPFELVFGQEVVLPVEVNLQGCRVEGQDALSAREYHELMMDRIDDVMNGWLIALREIEKEKLRIAWAYNKKVKEKSFQVNDLVWKTIFPISSRDAKFGKWSPSWEGPFQVTGIVAGNFYFVETLDRVKLAKALNGKYLKKFYLSVWQGS
jgi:hypothetical protein